MCALLQIGVHMTFTFHNKLHKPRNKPTMWDDYHPLRYGLKPDTEARRPRLSLLTFLCS